jgi:acyl carrier protein
MSRSVLSKEAIFERLKHLLIKEFELREEDVVPAAHLATDLDLDSIDWIDMAVALEQETGQKLLEDDLSAIRTIQDVVDLLHQRLNAEVR